ncbi:MAG: NADH-ubiquinone oxidoreductase-F iron-sulfur binding region domain-containing protein [Candidatus Limnocylindrales bacterium]|jgi:NADH:ubiquinone oxidoreductase subunit F (NADH-binding)
MTSANVLPTPDKWPHLLLPPASGSGAAGAGGAAPTDLDAAVAAGAFKGLTEAIRAMTAGEIVAALAASGLRGRGGAGFPTSEKWRACALAQADRRYVVVHAYQADPAVFTDRVLLERNPYAVLEGAAIAAIAVGASDVIVALRAEWTEAVTTLETSIREAQDAGYLGDDVLSSGRDIHVEVRPLQGAYMLGEETVLLKAIEGRRGQPEQQPPYPTTRGLYGKPTLVHNAQTFAVIPGIVTGGPGSYLEAEAKGSAGTVLVQISGSVANPGLAEIPLGTTIGEIVALAGGVPAPHSVKALLVGGPSGGILPPDALKTPYEFESLEAAGAHMGSGSIVVVDERSCLVDLASVLARFCADQACGKTIPCRIGLRRLAEIGARVCEGQPRGDEIGRLTDLSADIVASRLCDHERRSTLPLLSLVRYFRDELDAHIVRSACPAGICQPMAASRTGAVS